MTILLLLVSFLPAPLERDSQPVISCLEHNHYWVLSGNEWVERQQFIVWRAYEGRGIHVGCWLMVNRGDFVAREGDGWRLWLAKGASYRVLSFRETFTLHDPEISDRAVFPQPERLGLAGWNSF